MANIRISKRNIADTATITSSPVMSPVVTKLQDLGRWAVARSTFAPGLGSPTTAQIIYLDWSSNQQAAMLWLRMHNFSTSAQIQIQIYSDAARTSLLYNSGTLTPFSTTGLDTVFDVHTERDFRMLKNFVHYFTQLTTIRAVTITIYDASSAEGYFEASRIGMADYYEPTYNPPFGGMDMVPGDASKQDPAEDGTIRTDKSYKSREFRILLEFVPDDELDTVLGMLRYHGLDHDFFVDLYPEETGAKALYNRAQMKFTSMNALNPWMWGQHRNDLPLKEC